MGTLLKFAPRPKPVPLRSVDSGEGFERAEQIDAGARLPSAMFCDGLGADPVVCLDADDIQLIGLDITEARSDLMMAAKVADRATDKGLHLWLMARVGEFDEKLGELAGGGGEAA